MEVDSRSHDHPFNSTVILLMLLLKAADADQQSVVLVRLSLAWVELVLL